MCGRLSQSHLERMRLLTDIAGQLIYTPHYNIPPSSNIVAIRQTPEGNLEWATFYWGLIPSWAKDKKFGYKTFNAKAETVAQKPAFRNAFRRQRCIIPADGFYEWRTDNGKKQPFYVRNPDDKPLLIAGLWEHWEHEGEIIESCTIITTDANDLIRAIHTRMPVILTTADWPIWLDNKVQDIQQLQPLLKPYPGNLLTYKVDPRMNSPRYDDPSCTEKID